MIPASITPRIEGGAGRADASGSARRTTSPYRLFSKLSGHRPACLALGAILMFAATGLFAATNTPWFARAWQTDEGLPDNAVVGIAQTRDGFLWVATQGGLVRFDGNQFRDFAPITEVGVPSGLLHGLTVDRRDRLWVAKDGGLLSCVDQGKTTALILARGSANARAGRGWEPGAAARTLAVHQPTELASQPPWTTGRRRCRRDGDLTVRGCCP